MHAVVRGTVERDAVDEVLVRIVLEVLAAVRELAARSVLEEHLGLGAEGVFGVVCLGTDSEWLCGIVMERYTYRVVTRSRPGGVAFT